MSVMVKEYTDDEMDQYTSEELREMGFPDPCECLNMYVDYDDLDNSYNVCEDCGYSYRRPYVRRGDGWW